jgi:hypothetical protein
VLPSFFASLLLRVRHAPVSLSLRRDRSRKIFTTIAPGRRDPPCVMCLESRLQAVVFGGGDSLSPARRRTEDRVSGERRNRQAVSWSSRGDTAGTSPRFLASRRIPSVPVSGISSRCAALRPSASSRMTKGDEDSNARASTDDSPGPSPAASGRAGALRGSRKVTQLRVRRSGRSCPSARPASSSS